MINPGAKMLRVKIRTRNTPRVKPFISISQTFTREKMYCINLIMKKLQNMKNSTIEEISDLYEKAGKHIDLPPLILNPGETAKELLLRVQFCIQSRAAHCKSSKKFNISRLTSRAHKKPPGELYEEWKEKKKRISTSRKYAREIGSAYTEGENMFNQISPVHILDEFIAGARCPSSFAGTDHGVTPNNTLPLTTRTTFKSLASLPLQSLSSFKTKYTRSSTDQHPSLKLGKKSLAQPISLHRLKLRLSKIMNSCSEIEDNAVNSQKLIKAHRGNIHQILQKTQNISEVLSKDNMAQSLKNKYQKVNSHSELYHLLTSRQKKIINNIDDHLDVFARFTSNEAKEYLQKKQESSSYDSTVGRYTKEFTRKTALQNKNKKNSPYLIYMDKVISQIFS